MNKLIEKINAIPKGFFSFNDLRKIAGAQDQSLRVAVSRMIKRGEIIKISKGFYASSLANVDWEKYAAEYYPPNYLSFEWVLSKKNILSQKSVNLTLATTRRSRRINTPQNILIYHHLNEKIFWGFTRSEKSYVADAEKAFLDLAYLSLNGYAKFDPEEMNLKLLDKNKLRKYLLKIRSKRLTKLIKQLELV